MTRIHLVFAVLSLLAALASAASAPTFCKCSCFRNSTIIPLDPQYQPPPGAPAAPGSGTTSSAMSVPSSSSSSSSSSSALAARAGTGSCMECTRAFCLSNNLPICRGATELDVVAMCFQRDSRKDQIIVWVFLLATTGLLGWAGAQRVLQLRADRRGGGGSGSSSAGIRGGGASRAGGGLGGLGGLHSPRASSSGAGPRGQYAPLAGSREDS